MLIPAEALHHTPVMSLQTGGQLAITKAAVIDPRNLIIIAFRLEGPSLATGQEYLLTSDVREIGSLGIIVDSSDEFVAATDIIKLQEVIDFAFTLEGITVVDQRGKKLGKVLSYSLEPESLMIKQLNVKRPILKSLTDTELLIDRTQITEVTNTTITISHDEREPSHVRQAASNFSNPFRQQHTQPESIEQN